MVEQSAVVCHTFFDEIKLFRKKLNEKYECFTQLDWIICNGKKQAIALNYYYHNLETKEDILHWTMKIYDMESLARQKKTKKDMNNRLEILLKSNDYRLSLEAPWRDFSIEYVEMHIALKENTIKVVNEMNWLDPNISPNRNPIPKYCTAIFYVKKVWIPPFQSEDITSKIVITGIYIPDSPDGDIIDLTSSAIYPEINWYDLDNVIAWMPLPLPSNQSKLLGSMKSKLSKIKDQEKS